MTYSSLLNNHLPRLLLLLLFFFLKKFPTTAFPIPPIINNVKKVHNNFKTELMQWQVQTMRGSLFNYKLFLGREKGTWRIF